jgi:hypothetical protein
VSTLYRLTMLVLTFAAVAGGIALGAWTHAVLS